MTKKELKRIEERCKREIENAKRKWEEYEKEMKRKGELIEEVEKAINCMNLGIDFGTFNYGEAVEYLRDKGINISKRQKQKVKKIYQKLQGGKK